MKATMLFLPCFMFFVISCGGGTSTNKPIDPTEAKADGEIAFIDHDIDEAEKSYCDGFDDNPADSELAFGCFFSKLLALPESSESAALLAVFGENPINVKSLLLDDDAFFDDYNRLGQISASHRWPRFNYGAFDLPFASILTSGIPIARMAAMADLAVNNHFTSSQVKDRYLELAPAFAEFEKLLEVVLDDIDFAFSLPKNLFHADADVTVTYNDVRLFMAAVQAAIVEFAVVDAYDVGVSCQSQSDRLMPT